MNRQTQFSVSTRRVIAWRLSATLALLVVMARYGLAADEFQELLNHIPRSANAVVLLNMETLKSSPMGLKENWKGKIENAFAAGLVRVPPQAMRYVMASEIDFEFMEPIWEAAVMDFDEELKLEPLAKARGGSLDTIEGLPAVFLPNDTCLVQLGPKRLCGMAPANRQAVVRWIREVRKPSPPPLSPYLQKAAVYSDKTGSQIIMALDLDGVMSFERVATYLKKNEILLNEWQANDASPATVSDVTNVLACMDGIRVGVRIGEQSSSTIAVDLHSDASRIASFAKPLLLQVLSDKGAMIDDFQSWTVKTKGTEISLAGKLTTSGLRRLLSVIDTPAPESVAADAPSVSPGEQSARMAKKSRDYFRSITGMADDLKEDMKQAKNLASTSLYFDKYAKRIDRMPILDVDEELVDYAAYVANTLRQATGSVKTMGIQSNVRETQATGGGTYSAGGYGGYGYGYGYGGYRYGAYGAYGRSGQMADIKAAGAQKRVVRAEEKAVMATDVQKLRQELISATADMRRKMTQKYQIEF